MFKRWCLASDRALPDRLVLSDRFFKTALPKLALKMLIQSIAMDTDTVRTSRMIPLPSGRALKQDKFLRHTIMSKAHLLARRIALGRC